MREKHLSVLTLALLLLFTIPITTRANSESETQIKVLPPPIEVREDQNFTVKVRIYDAVDIFEFQFKISWDPTLVGYVSHSFFPDFGIPPIIVPQTDLHQAEGYIFLGASLMSPPSLNGDITLVAITFHALGSGTTDVTISDLFFLDPPEIMTKEDALLTILPPRSWVNVDGAVLSYGQSAAYGFLDLFANLDNWVQGGCVFTVPPLYRILIYPPPPLNFSLHFAWAINASTVKIDNNGSDLWISGYWAVSNVTNPRSVQDIVKLLLNRSVAAGTLSVTGNWTTFALNIEGYDPIQGNVTQYCVRRNLDMYNRVPRYDVNHDNKIDMRDIGPSCRAFTSTLGSDHYDFSADFNFDLKIDMGDIGVVCRRFGEAYPP